MDWRYIESRHVGYQKFVLQREAGVAPVFFRFFVTAEAPPEKTTKLVALDIQKVI
jgi:hypothetical protein